MPAGLKQALKAGTRGQAAGASSMEKPGMDKPAVDATSVERRRQAFMQIIAQQEATLLRAARRLCGGGEDQAQDLVQDTLIKGYAAYIEGRFVEGTNARAWLLRILTNHYITEYNRRQKWDSPLDVDAVGEDGGIVPAALRAAESGNPETALLAMTLDEPLERALASVSPDLRACVVLVDIEEVSYEDAARALDIPIGTVRSRLFRARQQLHAALHKYGRQRRNA